MPKLEHGDPELNEFLMVFQKVARGEGNYWFWREWRVLDWARADLGVDSEEEIARALCQKFRRAKTGDRIINKVRDNSEESTHKYFYEITFVCKNLPLYIKFFRNDTPTGLTLEVGNFHPEINA